MPAQFRASILSFLAFAAVFVCGVIYTLSLPKLYESVVRVWIQPRSADGGGREGSIYSPYGFTYNSPINTACEVLNSTAVTKLAVELLQTKTATKDLRLSEDDIRRGLKVDPVREADIVKVAFRNSDPKNCTPALKAIVDAFIRSHASQGSEGAQQNRAYLESILPAAKAKYLETREARQKFEDTNLAVNLDRQVEELLRQRSVLEVERQQASTTQQEELHKVNFLAGQLGIAPEEVISAENLARDEVLRALRQKLADKKIELGELRSRLQEDHPRIKALLLAIEEDQSTLKSRIKAISSGSNAEALFESFGGDSHIKAKMLEDLISARTAAGAAGARAVSIDRQLAEMTSRIKAVPGKEGHLLELKREEKMAQDNLSDLEKRLEATKQSASLSLTNTNIRVLDEPITPTFPAVPNVGLYLLFSFAAGVVAAIVVYPLAQAFDSRVTNVGQVSKNIDAPIVSWLPELDGKPNISALMSAANRLRPNVNEFLRTGKKIIVVTSPNDGDGKSTLAAALAMSLQEVGLNVLLVDSCFKNPSLARILGISASPGLCDLLSGQDVNDGSVVRDVKGGLKAVPWGAAKPNWHLDGPRMNAFLDRVYEHFDAIIFDAGSGEDGHLVFAGIDDEIGVIVVARIGNSKKEALRSLSTMLDTPNVQRRWVVAVGVKPHLITAPRGPVEPVETGAATW